MKTLYIFAVLLGIIITIPAYAQFDDFKLSDYKLPDIKIHKLNLYTYINSNSSFNQYQDQSSMIDTFRNKGFSGTLNTGYTFFRSNSRYQGTQDIAIYSVANFYGIRAPGNSSKTYSYPLSFVLSSYNKFYLSDRFFIGFDPRFSEDVSKRKEKDLDVDGLTRIWKNNFINVNVPLSVGIGRIEPVENARHAVYVLQELEKNGRLKNKPSDDVIIRFAELVSQLKNKRFFDSRLREIAELHAVDSFLVANDLITESDITYYAGLNDIWDYGYGPERNSGRIFSGGVRYNLDFREDDFEEQSLGSTVSNYSLWRTNSAGAFLRYQNSKPINLYWQSDLSITAGYDYEISSLPYESMVIIPGFNTNIIKGMVDYSVKYIPNTRTWFNLSAGSSIESLSGLREKIDFPDNVAGKLTGFDFSLSLLADIVYYFSPQLTLNFNCNVNYSWFNTWTNFNDDTSIEIMRKGLNSSFMLSLFYSIF